MADTSRSFATPKIYTDLPLLEPGHEDDIASFRFVEYATTFARMIAAVETRTPLVLGLSGKWGSGKTTLLRMIRARLDETAKLHDALTTISWIGANDEARHFRRCRTVWFNAWKYGDEDSLLAALIRAILSEMARGDWKDWAKGKALDKFFPRRDVVATFLSMFSFKLGAGDSGIEFAPDVDAHKAETPFAKNKAFFDDFSDAFDQLLAAWVHNSLDTPKIDPAKGVLTIFIDDLDRCLPAKTVQVLEAVKLFLDKRGVCFVIGADEAVIREAVKAYYRGDKLVAAESQPDALADKVLGEEAGKYLEKIFQVRFSLPPLRSAQLSEYMRSGLALSEELQKSIDLIVAGSETNPRRLKTTLNYLQLTWAILKNSGQATDDLRDDFILWLLIEMMAPNFAAHARNIEDFELRHKFVKGAIRWANHADDADWLERNEDVAGQYRAYEANLRLRRILKEGVFSKHVTAQMLDQFVYGSALELEAPMLGSISGGQALQVRAVSDQAILRGLLLVGGVEFLRVPAGKFLMGSREANINASEDEKPQHVVEITYDYTIGRFPVTNAQYRHYAKARNLSWKTEAADDLPAVHVNYDDAVAYCEWLTETSYSILPPNTVIRLPTEAEWEKAARGEFGNEYPWGNEWDERKCNNTGEGPTSVGKYSSSGGDSPYAVADMIGSVLQWCIDWYSEDEYKLRVGKVVTNPAGLASGKYRSLRGNTWSSARDPKRTAYRSWSNPMNSLPTIGFRVMAGPPVSR